MWWWRWWEFCGYHEWYHCGPQCWVRGDGHLQMRWLLQICPLKLFQKVLLIHLHCLGVFFLPWFSISFICGNHTVAIHLFPKPVSSALLYMKAAAWRKCILVIDSSGEPVVHPGFVASYVPGGSGTEFEVGRTIWCVEGANVTVIPPTDKVSSFC